MTRMSDINQTDFDKTESWIKRLGIEQHADVIDEMVGSAYPWLGKQGIEVLRLEFPPWVHWGDIEKDTSSFVEVTRAAQVVFDEAEYRQAAFTVTILACTARWIANQTLEDQPLSVAFLLPNQSLEDNRGGLSPFKKFDPPRHLSLESFETKEKTRRLCELARYPSLVIAVDLQGRATGLYRFEQNDVGAPSGDPFRSFGYSVAEIGGMGFLAPGDGTVRVYKPANGRTTTDQTHLMLVHDGFAWHTLGSHNQLRLKLFGLLPLPHRNYLLVNNPRWWRPSNWGYWLWAVIERVASRRKGGLIVLGPNLVIQSESFNNCLRPLREETKNWSAIDVSNENLDLICSFVELDGAAIVSTEGKLVRVAQKILDNQAGTSAETGTKHGAAKFIVEEFGKDEVLAIAISQDGPISLYFDVERFGKDKVLAIPISQDGPSPFWFDPTENLEDEIKHLELDYGPISLYSYSTKSPIRTTF